MTAVRLFIGTESLTRSNSGICCVARLMARVVADEMKSGRWIARAMSLNDEQADSTVGLPVTTARGSRTHFVLTTSMAALSHSHFAYDSLGMARAHCHIPLLFRPFMAWIHGIEVWENAPRHRISWARRANVLLSNSSFTREQADRVHGGFARARVCWLATETNEPAFRSAAEGSPTVLILGRMDAGGGYKGHTELIECWHRVVSAVPDARLAIVGIGPGRPYLETRRSRSPVADRIHFHGFIPDERLSSIWSEATVFSMPSRGEGFGLVYVEAMRQGLPIVASVHDAASEINLEGVTGFNVDLSKPDELPDRIIHLLKNRDLAAELGSNGRRRWAEHFNYSAFRSRFLPVLQEFLFG